MNKQSVTRIGSRRIFIRQCCRNLQSGASLVISFIMILVIMMLGVSATELALLSEKSSRNLRDRQIALEAAQVALIDARNEILGTGSRNIFFSDISHADFDQDCNPGSTSRVGLCNFSATGSAMGWLTVDFIGQETGNRKYVKYGEFTGAEMQVGRGSLTVQKPRYIIDVLLSREMGRCADCQQKQKVLYRVTAVGFGVRETTQVMLQATFSKDA
jgi:type IV pilus assembly protein PilX